jgi:SNF2 family DNA or RNA helicase
MLTHHISTFCTEMNLAAPLSLTAENTWQERGDIADRFQNHESRILIASTLAAGEGMNLQKCSDCLIVERQWNPANEEQAESRFIRIGASGKIVAKRLIQLNNRD